MAHTQPDYSKNPIEGDENRDGQFIAHPFAESASHPVKDGYRRHFLTAQGHPIDLTTNNGRGPLPDGIVYVDMREDALARENDQRAAKNDQRIEKLKAQVAAKPTPTSKVDTSPSPAPEPDEHPDEHDEVLSSSDDTPNDTPSDDQLSITDSVTGDLPLDQQQDQQLDYLSKSKKLRSRFQQQSGSTDVKQQNKLKKQMRLTAAKELFGTSQPLTKSQLHWINSVTPTQALDQADKQAKRRLQIIQEQLTLLPDKATGLSSTALQPATAARSNKIDAKTEKAGTTDKQMVFDGHLHEQAGKTAESVDERLLKLENQSRQLHAENRKLREQLAQRPTQPNDQATNKTAGQDQTQQAQKQPQKAPAFIEKWKANQGKFKDQSTGSLVLASATRLGKATVKVSAAVAGFAVGAVAVGGYYGFHKAHQMMRGLQHTVDGGVTNALDPNAAAAFSKGFKHHGDGLER